MINWIIESSVRNRFFVIIITGILIGVGLWSMWNTPVDAIPDLSDVQVIIFTEYPGQAPQVVEDQVTYPLTTAMLSVPYAKTVRGYSFFGFSMTYIIFEDGTDLYWARSRVLEYLNFVQGRLPQDVTPQLGPDATGVGWVYMYALTSDRHDLQQLRSIQDWYLRYELMALPGVAEVASAGGYVKQYQVEVDPEKLRAYGISLQHVNMAIKRSNMDVGGRLLEMGETEFMVRGKGYITSIEDLEVVPVGVDEDTHTPILLSQVANIQIGPEIRRGIIEMNGEGEAVAGIVIVRFGENALEVIKRVKVRLGELKEGLPEGVEIHTSYDRSNLILRAIDTLKNKLVEEMIVVAMIIVLFLLHLRSALVAIFTLPVGILVSFIIMRQLGINANIMSLGGIAIAIGVMVDAAVVMVENLHKHKEREPGLSVIGEKIEALVSELPNTLSAYSERVVGGNFIDITVRRSAAARFGLTVGDVQDVIKSAIGGMNVSFTVEGLERYPINVRYPRELRSDLESLKRVAVPTPMGHAVPLAQVADISISKGAPAIKSENARRTAWIYIDIKTSDIGGYVKHAREVVAEQITLPPGVSIVWSGQFEYMERANRRLLVVVPLTLVIIFLLLYIHFRSITESLIVMLTVPFAMVGRVWLLVFFGYNLSVAVAVGFIALAGLAAETGVVMLVYLDGTYERWKSAGRLNTLADLKSVIIEGAVDRVRPKLMTVATTTIGLLPIMFGTETGTRIMKRIAAPMVGGLVSSTILTLLILPAVYLIWKRWTDRKELLPANLCTPNQNEREAAEELSKT